MGFLADTRRAMLGPWHELECLKGKNEDGIERRPYRVRPKKFSQATSDRVAALQTSILSEGGAIGQVKALIEAREAQRALTEDEMIGALKLMRAMPKDLSTELSRLAIADGIGQHDFDDANGKLICDGEGFDRETIEAILSFGPLAAELTDVATRYNSPLLKASKRSSSGSSGGPSEETSSGT